MHRATLLLLACSAPAGEGPPVAPAPLAPVDETRPETPLDAALDATLVTTADPEPVVELAVLHRFGGLDVVETINEGRHEHGGPPAKLSRASINFESRDQRAHTIEVKRLSIVFANCDGKRTKDDAKALTITNHELYPWDGYDPIATGPASVTLPAGPPRRFGLAVSFDGIATYRACAFAIDLVVDRVRAQLELPLHIKRFEPLRRRD